MSPVAGRVGLVAALAGVAAFAAGFGLRGLVKPAAGAGGAKLSAPPPESAIPDNALGRQIAYGRAIFIDTPRAAPRFTGADLKCSSCHLDEGRLANAAPMRGAYGLYPQYRSKNGRVNTFAERLQDCFLFSMNGRAPPLGDPVLVAVESYAAFLAKGAPMGADLPGHGLPKLAEPPSPPAYSRGEDVYLADCAMCHGDDGAGRAARGATVFPPLWGARSYNWGAGMAGIESAAGFIKANMPLSQGGRLTDQQAWDVAAFIDSQPRPQDPRYTGSVAATRAKFHDTPNSMYGRTANGVLLGGDGPPKPFVAAGSPSGASRDAGLADTPAGAKTDRTD